MKKMISFLLSAGLCLSLAACGREEQPPVQSLPETETVFSETSVQEPPEPQAETVEITMDNWETYFELRSVTEPYIGESGRPEAWDFLYGVFLKPEYAQRFSFGQVDFEISYDLSDYVCTWDEAGVTLGEKIRSDLESSFETKTFGLEDLREDPNLTEQSPFYGQIAGVVYGGTTLRQDDGTDHAQVPENGKILRAEGTLTLQ